MVEVHLSLREIESIHAGLDSYPGMKQAIFLAGVVVGFFIATVYATYVFWKYESATGGRPAI